MPGQTMVDAAQPSWTWAIVAMALGVLLATWAMLRFAAQPEGLDGWSFAWTLLVLGVVVAGLGFFGVVLLLRQAARQDPVDEPTRPG